MACISLHHSHSCFRFLMFCFLVFFVTACSEDAVEQGEADLAVPSGEDAGDTDGAESAELTDDDGMALSDDDASEGTENLTTDTDDENTADASEVKKEDIIEMAEADGSDGETNPSPDSGVESNLDAGLVEESDTGLDAEVENEEVDASEGTSDGGFDASSESTPDTEIEETATADFNGDGAINILVLGSSQSISGGPAFTAAQISTELGNILSEDPSISEAVNVMQENIYENKAVQIGLGQNGAEYTYTHHRHSLVQYYYWPEAQEERWALLSSEGSVAWDYVVIAADPEMVGTLPGFYALGAHKIAAKVAAGGAQPLLLMIWPKDTPSEVILDHYETTAEQVGSGSPVELPVIPAGRAWRELPGEQKDTSFNHPSPNGAYLAAATLFSHMMQTSAAASDYAYDDLLAEAAMEAVDAATEVEPIEEDAVFVSPFAPCGLDDEIVSYNHTGTSSENGILDGLFWVFNQAPQTLQKGGETPINFNYGRANSNFEANKRYKVDPSKFDFSLGFPMQDHPNHGDNSMQYGIDKRDSGTMNETDIGVARFMVQESELPYARVIPIRTLFVQMREVMPDQSAYRDGWHMHRDLDKASAAYMYTLLTGDCVLGEEPEDPESDAWRTWTSHRIGYETAWTVMHLEAAPPCIGLDE